MLHNPKSHALAGQQVCRLEKPSWRTTLTLLGRLGSHWGPEQGCGCRAVWMAAARSWAVGLPAVQLTATPAPRRASAVLGPMAANCRDNVVTVNAQHSALCPPSHQLSQLSPKICSVKSHPSMELLSSDSGKMSIYLTITNTESSESHGTEKSERNFNQLQPGASNNSSQHGITKRK